VAAPPLLDRAPRPPSPRAPACTDLPSRSTPRQSKSSAQHPRSGPPLAADAGRRHIHPMLDLARLIAIHGARGRGQECEVDVRRHLARRPRVAISGDPRRPHGRRQELRTGLPSSAGVSSAGDSDPGGGGCERKRGHGLRAGLGSGAGVLARLQCQEGRRRGVLAGTADGPRTEDREETKEKIKVVGPTVWRGGWRASRNGG
jgi:hypothetical protein